MTDTGLTPGSASAQRPPEERRVVTILFADVTGSTALAERSDPEDVRAVLGRYYAIAREVIGAHGGTVEKFIGDAVMAVFGIPQAHGDDAERALAASLAMRAAVAEDTQTAELKLRIGVNTGEVVAARQSAGGDFLVTGDAVNVAARLQQNADPGAILVGQRTMRAVSGFKFGERERIAVKGKQEPIVGAVLVARVAERRERAPFLGRGDDLAQMQLVAQRAFKERRPQLVTITAPAGTGKSRLVEEFIARVAAGAMVATAQCLPYGAAVTFLPLRGLARGLLGVGEDAGLVRAIREAFAGAGYAEADATRLSSLIGTTLGDTIESERVDREEIFAAWRLLVEALASRGSLLVIFEDLHWASDTLLDLIEHVTASRAAAPLVMIALARQELLDRRPNWGGGKRNFTSIALEPLTQEETLRLVGMLTANVPEAIAQRIAERAGGNPFFAGELVRAYRERREAGEADDVILLPDTVHATVLARIDALPQGERTVLELAAVAGRTARVSAMRPLLPDVAEDEVIDALEALVDRELMTVQASDAYTFRHIVIREVAYATLPRAERVKAHLRLARAFEDAPSGGLELAELIAYHYRQAIALSPGGRLPEGVTASSVVHALERAARVASAAAAYGEARNHLVEAIRLSQPEDHQRLNEVLGDLMQFGDESVAAYQGAFEQWEKAGATDPAVGARLLIKRLAVEGRWRGSLSRSVGEVEFARLTSLARSLLDRSPDDVLESNLACANAFAAVMYLAPLDASDADRAHHPSELLRRAEAARRVFAARGDREAESAALDAVSAVHRRAGNFESALRIQRERVAAAAGLSLLERVDALGCAIWDLVFMSRFDEAIEAFEQARSALRPGEPEFMLAHATSWAAYASMLGGRWDKTFEIADLLVEMREQTPRQAAIRFTYPGWMGAIRVASARMDDTRLARYRSVFAAVADVGKMTVPTRLVWDAAIDGNARAAREYLLHPSGARDRKGETIALMVFDLGERLSDQELDAIEAQATGDPGVASLRIALARALNRDEAALRRVIDDLDRATLVADAARASALLALRTHSAADRAQAEKRLAALGDKAYLQKLAEEW